LYYHLNFTHSIFNLNLFKFEFEKKEDLFVSVLVTLSSLLSAANMINF